MPPSPTSSSPTSPMRTRKKTSNVPPGFIASPRPKPRPIAQLTVRELYDLHERNRRVLSSTSASTSSFVQRITAEQAEIENRLVEVEGVEAIREGMHNTTIDGDESMSVDEPASAPVPRILDAKRRALERFAPTSPSSNIGSMSMSEAIALERQAHAQDAERQQLIMEKKRRLGQPIRGEILSRKEREARIWAFMNAKPTESDLEDDEDEDDEDDEDPANWFEDDQDDGRKGQDLVEPDAEELGNIIRVDVEQTQHHYSTFYEPRDDDH
ncbi:hypothetical protein PLICRDRAFT_96994 [Plicaturopsis crispa FD-325 SS-3]|nr:hypothetical protein PLICRDRAFT_96994 [Plicaturopsis crispa FD-325 SS-3]